MATTQELKLSAKERKKKAREEREVQAALARAESERAEDHKNVIDPLPSPLAPDLAPSHTPPHAASAAPKPKGTRPMANDGTTSTAASAEKTRNKNLTYTYRDKDNEIQEKFSPDSRSVIMTAENGKSVEFTALSLVKDATVVAWLADNAPTALMAMLFGMKTTAGNSVTSVKNGSADEMIEAIEQRVETLVEGDWREGGERGHPPKQVLAAMCAWYLGAKGKEPSEEKKAQFWATIKEQGTKQVLTDTGIAAEFEEIKLAKQRAKVDKLRQEAGTSTGMSALLD